MKYGESKEPCEDTISRQAIQYLVYDMSAIDGEHYTEPHYVVDFDDIEKLPSVQPIRPRGHWIKRKSWDKYVCSECSFEHEISSKYCENCGADMRKSEG